MSQADFDAPANPKCENGNRGGQFKQEGYKRKGNFYKLGKEVQEFMNCQKNKTAVFESAIIEWKCLIPARLNPFKVYACAQKYGPHVGISASNDVDNIFQFLFDPLGLSRPM